MKLLELLEEDARDLVIIYPGRFHPFHIGHGKVYKYLKQKYSNAKVFISTSGKTDGDRSPFTFEEKKKMMMLAGVDSSAIVQSKSPYQSPEITEMFDPDKTVVVFAVSEKDMENEPRFDFSNGVNLKRNGEPAHMQKWEGMESADTVRKHSYIATTPTFPFTIRGAEINSASQIRNMISKSDDTELSQILQDLYNVADIPQDVLEIFKRKIGNSTMNENWSEDLTSAFLIEDNTMSTSILQALTESEFSAKQIKMAFGILNDPRYKQGNYSGAVSAIEKVAKGLSNHPSVANALKRANEAYNPETGLDPNVDTTEWDELIAKAKKKQEKEYANSEEGKRDPAYRHYHQYKTDESYSDDFEYGDASSGVAGLEYGQTEEEMAKALGMSQDDFWELAERVGQDQYGGLTKDNYEDVMTHIVDNGARYKQIDIFRKAGEFDESEERPYIVVHVKKGKHETHATSSYDAVKNAAKHWGLKSTAGINAHLADVEHVAEDNGYANEQHEQLEYIHHVLQECGDGNVDKAMVDQAIGFVEDIREQHFNADGSTKSESIKEDSLNMTKDDVKNTFDGAIKSIEKWAQVFAMDTPEQRAFADAIESNGGYDSITTFLWDDLLTDLRKAKADALGSELSKTVSKYGESIEKKVDEWVQDSPEQGFSGQERNFIQELCLRMDGISKSPNGLKWMGKSKTWDEGNVLSNKGKLTTVMLWAKKNIDDLYDRMGSDFKVYSDGNDEGESGRGQSDGNQIMQNIIRKIGKIKSNVNETQAQADAYHNETLTKLANKLKDMHDTLQWTRDEPSSDNRGSIIDDILDEIKEVMGELKHLKGVFPNKSYNPVHKESVKEGTSYKGYDIKRQNRKDGHPLIVPALKLTGANMKDIKRLIDNHLDESKQVTEDEASDLYHDNVKGKSANDLYHDNVKSGKNYNDYKGIQIHNLRKELKRVRQILLNLQDIEGKDSSSDMVNNIKGMLKGYEDILNNMESAFDKLEIGRHRKEGVEEGIMSTIGQGIDNVAVGAGKLAKKGAKKAAPHIKKAAKDLGKAGADATKKGLKKLSKIGSKNTSYNVKTGKTNTTYGMANAKNESVAADIKDYIDDHKEHFDAYPQDVEVDDKVYDWDEYWAILDKVYPDAYDNQYANESTGDADIEKMQDAYKYNEDRNAHSENILMLAHSFATRGEIKAIEGLLKITKQQGYVTPEQSKVMYNSIHKKYIGELFPIEESKKRMHISPDIAKAHTLKHTFSPIDKEKYQERDGLEGPIMTKAGKVLYYDNVEGAYLDPDTDIYLSHEEWKNLSESEYIDHFDSMAAEIQKEGILHYSDAKGTRKYSEGYKAAKDGVKYDENPYSGIEKLQWSRGHNDERADRLSAAGEPNYGARGQFESK